MQILRESFLYDLLPEGIRDGDPRRLLAALAGGFQDRLEDTRVLAASQGRLLEPLNCPPDLGAAILVVWADERGFRLSRYLPAADAPADPARLVAWAAEVLGIPPAQVVSAVRANDPRKAVTANALQHLAASYGISLCETGAAGTITSLDDQRRVVAGYFARLRIKGTPRSFEILGRLMGFGDVAVVPLWGRVSPRLPSDVGNAVNDPDFSAAPDQYPEQFVAEDGYDPHAFFDGPFYSWTSSQVSADPADPAFITSVNGRQPWFKVTPLAFPVSIPTSTVMLAGGGPHKKAAWTGGNLAFEAIAEGAAFNGFSIGIPTTGVLEVLNQNLSRIKYRTSYFDLNLTIESAAFAARFGSPLVTPNRDLQLFPGMYAGHPAYADGGVATPPFRPWAGGSASPFQPRMPAGLGAVQVDLAKLTEIGAQAVPYLDEARAATRFSRRVSAGLLAHDTVRYAPFNARSTLAVVTGLTVYSGTATGWPLPGYSVSIFVERPDHSLVPLAGENEISQAGGILRDRLNFRGPGVSGYYQFTDHTYRFSVTGYPTGSLLVARWTATDTEVVRPEPAPGEDLGYQTRPEDATDSAPGAEFGLADDVGWGRVQTVGGVVEDRDFFRSQDPPAGLVSLADEMTVTGAFGAEYELRGIDRTSSAAARPLRVELFPRSVAPARGLPATIPAQVGIYAPGQSPTAMGADGKLHAVGIVGEVVGRQAVLVADPQRWSAVMESLRLWWPLNHHPEAALAVYDHAPGRPCQPSFFGLQPADRVWTAGRGWVTRLRSNSWISRPGAVSSSGQLTVSAWVAGVGHSRLVVGPVQVEVNATAATVSVLTVAGPVTLGTLTIATGLDQVVVRVAGLEVSAVSGSASVEATLANPAVFSEDASRDRGGWQALAVTAVQGYAVTLGGRYRAGDTVTHAGRRWTAKVTTTAVPAIGSDWRHTVDQVALEGLDGTATWHDIRVWDAPAEPGNPGLDRPVLASTFTGVSQTETVQQAKFFTRQRSPLGLTALVSGWCYPGALPDGQARRNLALAAQYDAAGRWVGELRDKEVGLGAGWSPATVTGTKTLEPVTPISADGRLVVVSSGAIPGQNPAWASLQPSGQALAVELDAQNPVRDTIWLRGDTADGGYTYAVRLEAGAVGAPRLAASRVFLDRPPRERLALTSQPQGADRLHVEQPGGGESVVASNFGGLAVRSSGDPLVGEVYARADRALAGAPPVYLYLHSRIHVLTAGGELYARWIRRTPEGEAAGLALRNSSGTFEFSIGAVLPAGNYRLEIDAANVGTVDRAFDGFDVAVTLINPAGLAVAGATGSLVKTPATRENPHGLTTFDLVLESELAGGRLQVEWTNDLDFPALRLTRALCIQAVTFRQMTTSLYRLGVIAGPVVSLSQVALGSSLGDVTDKPGGWLVQLNNAGQFHSARHEAEIYPSLVEFEADGTASQSPLADLLTGSTVERRDRTVLL